MRKRHMRITAALIAVLMLVATFTACGDVNIENKGDIDVGGIGNGSGNGSGNSTGGGSTVTYTYTVTFNDWDGKTLKVQKGIKAGESATAPEDPIRAGYTFTGWDKAFDNVTEDITTTATYRVTVTPGPISCTHKLVYTLAKDASCTANGNIAYYRCSECEKYFVDAAATAQIAEEQTVIEAEGHSLKATDSKSPSCTADGNIAYWYCDNCKAYFDSETAENKLAEKDLVISATGHTPIIDEAVAPTYETPGLTEGSHCSTCGTIITAQKLVDPLTLNHYSITYKNIKTASVPKEYMEYTDNAGFDLPENLVVDGYKFEGWYTAVEGGEKVVYIPKGSNQNYVFYAHWTLVEYTITFDCGNGTNSPSNITENGVKRYTIETPTFTLADASKAGYTFLRWENEAGEKVTKIEKGTAGDINLTAVWTSMRYVTVPVSEMQNPNYKDSFYYDSDNDIYTFVYYLGCVENVPLSEAAYVFYNGLPSVTMGYEVSSATTKSVEDSLTKAKETTVSTNISSTISAKAEGVILATPVSIEASISASIGASETVSESRTVSMAVEKSSQTSTSFELTIPEGSPAGYYRMVYMGTVDMFSAVVYDAKNDVYEIAEYSLIRDNTTFALDCSASSSFDDHIIEKIEFSVPKAAEDFIISLTEKTDGIVINAGTGTVTAYNGDSTDVIIPAYYDGVKVTGLADGVFSNKNITSVKLGQFIEKISDNAFYNCSSLQSVAWSDNVTSIGDSAFYGCTSLNTQIPVTVTSVGNNAFAGCTSLKWVTINENVTEFGTDVFSGCDNLTVTVYPSSNSIAVATAKSGANKITVDCSDTEANIGNITIQVPDTTDTFTLIGREKAEYSNIYLVSNSLNTVIENLSVTNTKGGIGLQIYSANTALTNAFVVMSGNAGNAVQFFNDNADLTVHKIVTLTGGDGSSAGVGLIAVNITIHTMSDADSATLNVTGGNGNSAGSAVKVSGTLTVDGSAELCVKGGNGNAGYNGACGEHQGYNGESGGVGYSGGVGIEANSVFAYNGSSITTNGGIGGAGGKGGCCNPDWGKKEYGGNGGAGGNGGYGVNADSITVDASSTVTVNGGNGGTGGTAGGVYKNQSNGVNGSVGSGGAGGLALNVDCVVTGTVNQTNGTVGANGSGIDCAGH